jgi:hypothetical protein
MGTGQSTPAGPDLALGIPTGGLPDGHLLAGHVGDDGLLGQTKAVRGELAILGRCFHTNSTRFAVRAFPAHAGHAGWNLKSDLLSFSGFRQSHCRADA